MASQYEVITLQDMNDVLLVRGFKRIDLPIGEHVYEKVIDTCHIRIYTSIDKRNGKSRDIGADAIRIVIVDSRGDFISGEKRINRSHNWQIRLNARIDNWSDGITWCDRCGNPMKLRKGKFGEFLGCAAYPLCKNTKSIE